MKYSLVMELVDRIIPNHGGSPTHFLIEIKEVDYIEPGEDWKMIGYKANLMPVAASSPAPMLPQAKKPFIVRLIKELVLALPAEKGQEILNVPSVMATLWAAYGKDDTLVEGDSNADSVRYHEEPTRQGG
jgi:hypothetical protein